MSGKSMTENTQTAQQLAEQAGASMYRQDRASAGLGITLSRIAPGYARMQMTVRDDMLNGHRVCHGGIVFALADTAMAFASNSHDQVALAARAAIDFLAPAQAGDRLTAIAEQRMQGKRSGVYDVSVYNQQEQLIALFRGNTQRIRGTVAVTG